MYNIVQFSGFQTTNAQSNGNNAKHRMSSTLDSVAYHVTKYTALGKGIYVIMYIDRGDSIVEANVNIRILSQ